MFKDQKTRDAVSYSLVNLGGKSTYAAITKLLSIADRVSLEKQGRPITGDQMVALPQGPILSVVLDRMNGSHAQFANFIRNGSGYEVSLLKAKEPDDLTFSDIGVLDEVLAKFGKLPREELKAATHQFPEWQKYDRGSDTWSIIPLHDVAEAVGLSQEQRDSLIAHIRELETISRFYSDIEDQSLAAV